MFNSSDVGTFIHPFAGTRVVALGLGAKMVDLEGFASLVFSELLPTLVTGLDHSRQAYRVKNGQTSPGLVTQYTRSLLQNATLTELGPILVMALIY